MAFAGSYGVAVSYGRGTPVHGILVAVPSAAWDSRMLLRSSRLYVQGYLAHKKTPPPRILQFDYALGPVVVLWRGAVSYERGTPAAHLTPPHGAPGWYPRSSPSSIRATTGVPRL